MSHTFKNRKKREVVSVPDHHIPLANFIKQFGTDTVPVPIEEMITKAGVEIQLVTNHSINGAALKEIGDGLVMRIYIAARQPMTSAARRQYVTQAFGKFLAGEPDKIWSAFETDTGLGRSNPYVLFSHRFTADLLVPERELRELLKPIMPCTMREAWTAVSVHFDVPMLYAIQRVKKLKFETEFTR